MWRLSLAGGGGGRHAFGVRRTIIIGDVHGCRDELEALLVRCGAGGGDRVILVGDLVAKGPDSQGVVQLARERGMEAVMGNHDAKVLDIGPARDSEDPPPKIPALPIGSHAYVARQLRPRDWAYLEAMPLYLPVPELDLIVVHAGLVPGLPLYRQPRKMLLNIRSVAPDGEPSKRQDAGVPWASLWPGPAHVVFGHDAMRGLQQHPFATGLDTGCVYGQALTAMIFPGRELISQPARRAYVDM
jgi:hypothetical protein